jgi:transposase
LMVEQPEEVVRHRPEVCHQCGEDLHQLEGIVVERRQVFDLPEIRLRTQQHQIEAIRCPHCQERNLGNFPAEVKAPVQYGPNLQALAVYLNQGQLLPTARTCETLAALCGCQISEATVIQWGEVAAERLAPTMERIAELLATSPLQHGDETGIRIYGMLHWLHVNCTRFLTHLAWHESRGKPAMNDIGIWPRFAGRGMHDRLTSYEAFGSAHSLCGAHLLRDCAAVAFEILAAGYAAQPPPSPAQRGKGRRKQSKAKNLLDALLGRADQVLAFLDDLRLPFSNNLAERDLRMAKVQQKISGTFRSATGATVFCRIRSYLSTMQKQGHTMLPSLVAVFNGHPFPVAWAPK